MKLHGSRRSLLTALSYASFGLAMLMGMNPGHAENPSSRHHKSGLVDVSSLFPLDTPSPLLDPVSTGNNSQVIGHLNAMSADDARDWQTVMTPKWQSHLMADRLPDDEIDAPSPTNEESSEVDGSNQTSEDPSDLEKPSNPEDNGDSNLWRSGRPDGHAPIGVMGDHTHDAGEFMFSYRFMRMDMAGNRDGTTDLSPTQVLEQFPVSPTEMTMDVHMLGVMYAPTDELTVSAMAPYIFNSMEHVTRMGRTFTTQSEGFGDIRLMGLYKILDQDRQRIHLNTGISLPTGSTNQRDDIPAGPNQVLPYPMQIGSGTFDLLPGITYLGQSDHWSWGGQARGTIRLGRNGNGYRLGNRFNMTAWGARRWNNWFSTSVRLDGNTWGNISGADPRLNPTIIPTADPNRRGGTRLDAGIGLNFLINKGALASHRLAIEFALPVYQSLDGPQLETDWLLTVGWQKAF